MHTIALLQSAGSGNGLVATIVPMLPIVAIGLVFYFLVIAPANKQRRTQAEMIAALKKGDAVITNGGIYGSIQAVEGEVVHLKVADNVKIRVARSAITGLAGRDAE
jgi:preprotein translocase subunit YajC